MAVTPTIIIFNDMSEELLQRITIDPEICFGKPTIRGLRYPVFSMLEYLAGGDTIDDILELFPDLEREDLYACLAYAAIVTNRARTEISLTA
jgi:uncharacterized protein (DUF433 family)